MPSSTFRGLEIGKSGLNAASYNLDVTGHNISNVNTAGYTRQRTITSARVPAGQNYVVSQIYNKQVGQGVSIDGVQQVRSTYLDAQYRDSYSSFGYADARTTALTTLESIYDEFDEDTSLKINLESFIEAFNEFSSDTSDTTGRTAVKSAAEALMDNFQYVYAEMVELYKDQSQTVSDVCGQVNVILNSVAELNASIAKYERVYNATGDQSNLANDLRDQRNLLLDELSLYTDYTYSVSDQSVSMVDIAIGGINVLTGTNVTQVTAREVFVDDIIAGYEDAAANGTDYKNDMSLDVAKLLKLSGVDSVYQLGVAKETDGFSHILDEDGNRAFTLLESVIVSDDTGAISGSYDDINKLITVTIAGNETVLSRYGSDALTKSDLYKYSDDDTGVDYTFTVDPGKNVTQTATSSVADGGFTYDDSGDPPTLTVGGDEMEYDAVSGAFKDPNDDSVTYIYDAGENKLTKAVKTELGSVCDCVTKFGDETQAIAADGKGAYRSYDYNSIVYDTLDYGDEISGGQLAAHMNMMYSGGTQSSGIPYYMNEINSVVREITMAVNDVHLTGYTYPYSDSGTGESGESITNVLFFDVAQVADDEAQMELVTEPPYFVCIDTLADDGSITASDVYTTVNVYSNQVYYTAAEVEAAEAAGTPLACAEIFTLNAETGEYESAGFIKTENEVTTSVQLENMQGYYYDYKNMTAGADKFNFSEQLAGDNGTFYIAASSAPVNIGNDSTQTGNNEKVNDIFKSITDSGVLSMLTDVAGHLGLNLDGSDDSLTTRREVLSSVEARRTAIAGVSMDEESTSLIVFQETFNACSRVITTMDEMLDRMINSMGRVGL